MAEDFEIIVSNFLNEIFDELFELRPKTKNVPIYSLGWQDSEWFKNWQTLAKQKL